MMKEKLNISASNIINVCIDNIDGVERSGRFYCYYSEEPIFFRSIHELFRYMERFMERAELSSSINRAADIRRQTAETSK